MNEHPTPEPARACARCGHPDHWHRHDDGDNTPLTDPDCKFRCIGYDCEAPGRPPKESPCNCPDFVEVHFQPPSPAQGTRVRPKLDGSTIQLENYVEHPTPLMREIVLYALSLERELAETQEGQG